MNRARIQQVFMVSMALILTMACPTLSQEMVKVVETEKAALKDIQKTIRLVGTVKAKHSTIVLAKTVGTLIPIKMAGERVMKGELIAKLDNTDLLQSYDLSVKAETLAKSQYNQATALAKAQAISRIEVDDKNNQLITAQKALASARLELEKVHYLAPFDGVVGSYKVREGSQVSDGDQIVTLFDPDGVIVEFDIPATSLDKIKNGQSIFINDQETHLTYVQMMIDPETHMSPVYVDYKCDACIAGSNVPVDLVVESHKGVIVVPTSSVCIKDDKPVIYVIENGKVVVRPVEAGIREKDQVEIISGLKEGDEVIVRGQTRLYESTPVKVAEVNADKPASFQMPVAIEKVP